MKVFHIAPDAFASQAVGQTFSARMEQQIHDLVARYGLRNKTIVSLGPRWGREEYFFSRHGNHMTLIDNDFQGDLAPALEAAPPGDMRYILADATELHLENETFDAMYLSGYRPDIYHRGDTIRQRDTETFRRTVAKHGFWTWPEDVPPFHASVMRFAGYVRAGGTIINQSYAHGFDIDTTPTFLPTVDRQLAAHGLRLVEFYCLEKSRDVHLFVIAKGNPTYPLASDITIIQARREPEPVAALRTLN
jgi:hypothetical protein